MTGDTSLQAKLSAVRSRWIARDAALAGAMSVLAVLPVCLLLGWLDYRLDFSRTTRLLELCGLVGWFVWVARRWVVPPLRERRDAHEAALRVEAVEDRFGGRLVSLVEFSGASAGESRGSGSPDLIAAMGARVNAQADAVDFNRAIDFTSLRKPIVAAAMVLLLTGTALAARPDLAATWLRRTANPFGSAAWARRTTIVGVRAGYKIRRGDTLTVSASVQGEVPYSGEISWQTEGHAAGGGAKSFDIQPDGKLVVHVGPLTESIAFEIEAGDAVLGPIPVTVVTPPELTSVRAVYHYPAYTGRAADEVQSGDVRALVGTRIDLAFTADRPVERAELVFLAEQATHPASSPATQPQPMPVELSSPLEGTASFMVRQRCRYQVVLKDADGFASDSPATFVIDPVDDRLPEVALLKPDSVHQVTPATRLQLRFDASDDYGVTRAAIRWRRRSSEPEQQKPLNEQPIMIGEPRRAWNGSFAWDLGTLGVQPGDVIEYFLEVSDAGEHLSGQKSARTPVHTLEVTDAETLRKALEDAVQRALGEIDSLARQQSAGMDALAMSIVSLPNLDDTARIDEARRIQNETNRQASIRRQSQRIATRIEGLADELAESYLAEPQRIAELREIARGLTDISDEPMQRVMDKLEAVRTRLTDKPAAVPAGRP